MQSGKTLDVNLAAVMLQAQALYPLLKKSSGTLTLIGSVAHKGSASIPAYAASKAGLHGLARALRSEWGGEISVQICTPARRRPTCTTRPDMIPAACVLVSCGRCGGDDGIGHCGAALAGHHLLGQVSQWRRLHREGL
jgi:NAD(P)-dependent dehydrogenase (short-subunit alcohol dehydrogenase family)